MTAVKKTNRGGRPSKRDYILKQAELLVQEQGASNLTFDSLTEKTGISKGGLLYHFASKEALIVAMLERYIGMREARTEELINEGISGPNAEIKAVILGELNVPQSMLAVDSAIIAAAANNPALLEPVKHKFEELWATLNASESGGARAQAVWKAAVGDRLLRQFGLLDSESPEQREAFIAEMMALLDAPDLTKDNSDSVFG
ncbi:TetR/AcrR family transcriptional regulator [Aliidiomarina iranensis]|uniref:TetR/AcrR family transcriptional regulator n=1 Tax=Aliidiomarina iranensis TaxID=1434071 RepID=A0A432W2V8_9GAMM|nr:TetR/AcrR family transcriptional regulator [Aliidiomarina iranensis]RUO23493.1 TetR/AcrR family transcriptional regulator [Aliidiomarina iranensis]